MLLSAFGPGSEKGEEVKKRFWEEMIDCVDCMSAGEKVFALGNLNVNSDVNDKDAKVVECEQRGSLQMETTVLERRKFTNVHK